MAKTIVVVEDNALNMKLFNDVLQANGYETVLSADGHDILEIAYQRRADLIIMDVQLPELSGLDLTKSFKADERLKHLPILVVTAHATQGNELELRRAGCDDYVPKPISIPDFLETVARHLT